MKNSILIIDADQELVDLLANYLENEGFLVERAYDGEIGEKKALNQEFDAIILEVMLPKRNGFEILRTIRTHKDTPVMLLSSRSEEVDTMVGFELGADEYLTKPCNPQELLARLRSIVRRTKKAPVPRSVITRNEVTLDCAKRHLIYHGENLEVTNTEFNILEMLMKSPGQAFSKEELTEYALGRKYTAYDRSIDVHISNLRNKLGDNLEGEPLVKTVRGFGYLFNG